MDNDAKCLKCGAQLDRGARDGVCPKCFLGQALASFLASQWSRQPDHPAHSSRLGRNMLAGGHRTENRSVYYDRIEKKWHALTGAQGGAVKRLVFNEVAAKGFCQALAECQRVLVPGGRLIATVTHMSAQQL